MRYTGRRCREERQTGEHLARVIEVCGAKPLTACELCRSDHGDLTLSDVRGRRRQNPAKLCTRKQSAHGRRLPRSTRMGVSRASCANHVGDILISRINRLGCIDRIAVEKCVEQWRPGPPMVVASISPRPRAVNTVNETAAGGHCVPLAHPWLVSSALTSG